MIRRVVISCTLLSILSGFFLLSNAKGTAAVEITVLSAGALQSAMDVLIPEFERSTGNTVRIRYGPAGNMVERFQKGEAADVLIVTGKQIDALQQQGKVVAGSRVDIAKVGIGVFIRKGAPKPDISSVEAFKRALLAAKSISYPSAESGSPVGAYLTGLLERMGIAAELKPKTIGFDQQPARFEAVARGDVELGMTQVTVILAEPKVEFVGPFPAAIQNYTDFSAGILQNGLSPDAAQAFIRFISSPAAIATMKEKGFEVPERPTV